MNSIVQTDILNFCTAGELYKRLRYWLKKTDNLIVSEFKDAVDLIVETLHKKVSPFYLAIVNTQFLEKKISLEEAALKLDYFQKIYSLELK